MLDWSLKNVGRRRFSHISGRKAQEHAAEEWLVGWFFGDLADGVFVDVGANQPEHFNQTWLLEQRGWSGVLIEPLPELCVQLRERRPRSQVVQAACGAPDQRGMATLSLGDHSAQASLDVARLGITPSTRTLQVPLRTLDEILDTRLVSRADFISIDVEGFQLEVLRGFSPARFHPRLMLVEDHLLNWRTHRHLKGEGYRLVKRTGLNNWYIPVGEPFAMTDWLEQLQLWSKVFLRMPWRALRHRITGRG